MFPVLHMISTLCDRRDLLGFLTVSAFCGGGYIRGRGGGSPNQTAAEA